MTWGTQAQEPPSPPPAPFPGAPGTFLFFLAVFTLLLSMFRRQQYVLARRERMPEPSEQPPPPGPGLPAEDVDRLEAEQPLAVFLVGGDHRLGLPALNLFANLYSREYRQVLFVSVGMMDYDVVDRGAEGRGDFQGTQEAGRLKKRTRLELDPYLAAAHQLGLKADCRISIATNAIREIDALSDQVVSSYPRAVFFVSKLVFPKTRWYHRLLHGGTSDEIRNRLEQKGFPVTVLPIVVPT